MRRQLLVMALAAALAVPGCGKGEEAPEEAPAPEYDEAEQKAVDVFEQHVEGWTPCHEKQVAAQAQWDGGDHSMIVQTDLDLANQCAGKWLMELRPAIEKAGVPLDTAQGAYDKWAKAKAGPPKARFQ